MYSVQCTLHIYSKPETIYKQEEKPSFTQITLSLLRFRFNDSFVNVVIIVIIRTHVPRSTSLDFWRAVAHSFIERFLNSFQCMSFKFGAVCFQSFSILNLDAHPDWIELFSTIQFHSMVIQRWGFFVFSLWYFYDYGGFLTWAKFCSI